MSSLIPFWAKWFFFPFVSAVPVLWPRAWPPHVQYRKSFQTGTTNFPGYLSGLGPVTWMTVCQYDVPIRSASWVVFRHAALSGVALSVISNQRYKRFWQGEWNGPLLKKQPTNTRVLLHRFRLFISLRWTVCIMLWAVVVTSLFCFPSPREFYSANDIDSIWLSRGTLLGQVCVHSPGMLYIFLSRPLFGLNEWGVKLHYPFQFDPPACTPIVASICLCSGCIKQQHLPAPLFPTT